jgi:hypothetical protein
MDKSFNDQELSDIMKEIEALEEGFESEDEIKTEASPVMEELAEMEEEKSVPIEFYKEPSVISFEKKAPVVPEKSSAPASMSFKVQGEMNIELQFDIGGKTIQLAVSETGLNIQMEGGMTFSVPVNDAKTFKKAV